jgi:membrane protein
MDKLKVLVKQTFKEFGEDKVTRLAAALSYFTVFSLAPLLVIVIAVAGFFFGEAAVQGRVVGQIEDLIGTQGAQMIETMIASTRDTGGGIAATAISVFLLLFGASGVFAQLQDAMNTIWEVQPKPNQGFVGVIKTRFLSFTMILGIAFLLLVSLVLSAAMSALGDLVIGLFPGANIVMAVVNILVSFLIVTLLFAMIYKILPDVEIAWSDVWLGAAVTALLFTVGKELIGLYLGRAAVGSTYGAAGSLVIILLWVFYSAQILFLGAEFTQVYANRHGSRIQPTGNAIRIDEEARIKQGIPHRETVEQGYLIAAGEPAGIQQVEEAPHSRYLQEEDHPGLLKRPRTGSEKAMTALAGLVAALLSVIGALILHGRRR